MNDHIAIFMATSGHSGVDRAMKNLIPAIARRGYRIDLLKVRKHGPNLDEPPPGLRVIDLGSSHVYSSLPGLIRYLRDNRPVAMLSDKDRVNRTAFLAKVLARVPTRLVFRIGTTLSLDLADRGRFDRWLQRTSVRHLYPRAHAFIVNSRGVRDDMVAYTGIAAEHVSVVQNPAVAESLLDRTQPLPQHPWFHDGGPPVILGVGELSARKDFETLLRGFARLRAQTPCRLLILGRGRRRERLLQLAEKLGIADALELPGFIADPYPYMAHAALFAFTSTMEGLPFALVEALAVGTPVVATDCRSGPREILQDGRYGPLVPVGDDERLAEAMLATLTHPHPKAFLQDAARPYEIERSATAYLAAMGLPAHARRDSVDQPELNTKPSRSVA